MSGILITVFVVLWVISAINSVSKAVKKAQAAAGGPDAIRAAVADAAAQSEATARTAAARRAAAALRVRMQAAATGSAPASTTSYSSPLQGTAIQDSSIQSTSATRYSSPFQRATAAAAALASTATAPAADQAMSALTSMVAPSMPAFDAPGFDAGFSSNALRLPGAYASTGDAVRAGREFLLPEGANIGASAIIAATVIGPPLGLRSGGHSASDW
jgi:hypothetical protein